MRSFVVFAALALSGAVDLASASPCKPRTSATETSAASETLSVTKTTSGSETLPLTGTTSGSVDATTLPDPPAGSIIENAVTGGGLTSLEPFTIEGDVTIDPEGGLTTDGSTDTSAARMGATSQPPSRKRQSTGEVAALMQTLSNLNTLTQYTVQFYYHVSTPPQQTASCQLEALIGTTRFFTTSIVAESASVSYNRVLVSTSVPAAQADLIIRTSCTDGGSAVVLVDSLFISNQVTVDNIDDFRLDFGDGTIREPVSLPATTSGVQEPETTGTVVVEPTSAGQAFETTAVSENSDEQTSAGEVVPTTSAGQIPGEETTRSETQTVQPTDATQEPTTIAQTDAADNTSAASNSEETTSAPVPVQGSSESTSAQENSVETTSAPVDEDVTSQTVAAVAEPTTTQAEADFIGTTSAQTDSAATTSAPVNEENTETAQTGLEETTQVAFQQTSQPPFEETSQTQAGSEQTPQSVFEETSQTQGFEESSQTQAISEQTPQAEFASTSQTRGFEETSQAQAVSEQTPQAEFVVTSSTEPAFEQTSEAEFEATSQTQSETAEVTPEPIETTSQEPTETETSAIATTTSPPEVVANQQAPEIVETTSATQGTPVAPEWSEQTLGALNNAEPAQTECLGENLIANGDFELGAYTWDFQGRTDITYNGEISMANSGNLALAMSWPAGPDNVKAGFKHEMTGLTPTRQYYLGYGFHVADGAKLPTNECKILVKFGGVQFDSFDPFYDNRAWSQYRNRMNYIAPASETVELSFELSCKSTPAPFTLMMDDVFLTSCAN
ncbi:hypothetical protein F66182_64 [Fusarium sp. NRRL 66182]|nr:hypothetical protein F66182_64 [Fusarium sp. NRRL 66182]